MSLKLLVWDLQLSVELSLMTKPLEFSNCGRIRPMGFNSDGTLNSDPIYGFKAHRFTSETLTGGNVTIVGGSVNLGIDTVFTGVSTVINNRTYYLGQSFTSGVSTTRSREVFWKYHLC